MFAAEQMKLCESILVKEGVTYSKQSLADIIIRYFPDLRKTIADVAAIEASAGLWSFCPVPTRWI